MIIDKVVLVMYAFCTITSLSDELWNINHPRPHPVKQYHLLQWEVIDFYSYKIKGEWVLRQKRKTDSKLKKRIRRKYWKKRKAHSIKVDSVKQQVA